MRVRFHGPITAHSARSRCFLLLRFHHQQRWRRCFQNQYNPPVHLFAGENSTLNREKCLLYDITDRERRNGRGCQRERCLLFWLNFLGDGRQTQTVFDVRVVHKKRCYQTHHMYQLCHIFSKRKKRFQKSTCKRQSIAIIY
jgi:hypothetical protein